MYIKVYSKPIYRYFTSNDKLVIHLLQMFRIVIKELFFYNTKKKNKKSKFYSNGIIVPESGAGSSGQTA